MASPAADALADFVTKGAERIAELVSETNVSRSGGNSGMASGPLMAPPRDNDRGRLARIDAMLTHLRDLEKDTGRIISSLQRERRRTKADMASDTAQAGRARVTAKPSPRRPARRR
jgi:hypothetical protein